MAFGDLRGTLVGNGNSVTNPSDLIGSVAVSVGDLVYVVFGQQTGLTASGVTDDLGNTYTALNAGNDPGTPTARAFYSRVTTGGTLTTVSVAATASANDYAGVVAVIEGPFVTSPLDANPANGTNDVTSPFTCPATGTLAQANEAVLCFYCATSNATFSATSPNLLATQRGNASAVKVVVGHQTVAATTTVSPEFTGTNPTGQSILGTASFKKSTNTNYDITITPSSVPIAGGTVAGVFGREISITPSSIPIAGANVGVTAYLGVFQRNVFQNNVFQVFNAESISYSITITASAMPIAGATVVPVFGKTVSITPATMPIGGSTVAPAFGRSVAIAASSVPIVGSSVALAYGRTTSITPASVPIGGATVAPVFARSVAITASAVPITGSTVAPVFGRTVSITASAVPIGGQSVETVFATAIAVTASSVPITGQDVVPVYQAGSAGYAITITAGSVPVTGQTVEPAYGWYVSIVAGSVPVSGQTVASAFGRALSITPAAMPIGGQAIAPVYATAIAVTPSSIPISGSIVASAYGQAVEITASAIPLVGQSVAPVFAVSIPIAAGSVPIAGQTVAPVFATAITITASAVPITGANVTSVFSRTIRLTPDDDVVDGSWTNELGGTILYTSIDESVADDADYIQSSINPVNDLVRIQLSNPATGVAQPVKLKYRYKKNDSPTAANLTARLKQGAVEIAAWTHTDISSSFVTATQTLTEPQFAAITDFTNLFVELEADI